MKKRSEVDPQYQWDLSEMISSKEEYKVLELKFSELCKQFQQYKGHVLDSADCLLKVFEDYSKIECLMEQLCVYPSLLRDIEASSEVAKELMGSSELLGITYNESVNYLIPELLNGTYEMVEEYMKINPKLLEYSFVLKAIFLEKEHVLSEKEEAIFSSLSPLFSQGQETFYALQNMDMKFGKVKDINGEMVELTESNFDYFMEVDNRDIRKNVFKQFYSVYHNLENTYARSLSNSIQSAELYSRIHRYENSLEESFSSDQLDVSLYNHLIKTTRSFLPSLRRFYNLRKEILGLDIMYRYDLSVDLIKRTDKDIPYESAMSIVIDSLKDLGPLYQDQLKKGFQEGWVDVYPSIGKTSGGYSWGTIDSKPYILLNYLDDFNGVLTLAHEMGHSVAHVFSKEENNPFTTDFSRIISEVPSVTNELLVNQYMYEHTESKTEKLYYLEQILNLFNGSVFRQVMFAELEQNMHNLVLEMGQGSAQQFNSFNHELMIEYYGDAVLLEKEESMNWARLSHFHMNYYVYSYAIGMIVACMMSKKLQNDATFSETYLKFLRSGGSKYPLEILRDCGIDLLDENTLKEAFLFFEETLDKFECTYRSLKMEVKL